MPQSVRLRRDLYLPRALVFEAWTRAEHVAEWYPPTGGSIDAIVMQPTPGGGFELTWTDPGGTARRETGTFLEIHRPQGFECTVSCADADGGCRETHLRLSLCDLEDTCRVELDHSGLTDGAAQALRESWEGRLDRLESYFSAI